MKKLGSLLLIILMLTCVVSFGVAEEAAVRPLLLQGAMTVETEAMMEALEDAEAIELYGFPFVTGTLDGYPVVVSRTLVGMVNAAQSTTIAIMTFDPIAVINQGTAGGHDEALHKGDIVLGVSTVNINNFRSEWADVGAGIDATKWINSNTSVLVDGEIQSVDALYSDEGLLEIARSVSGKYEAGNVVEGVIGSGDVWNKELDRINLIHAQQNTSCEEMETFAVAQVCSFMDVPFLGVRVLSNNELHKEDFDPQTGIDCQMFTLEIAKAIISAL